MAKQQQNKKQLCPVLLGFVDEEISGKYATSVNYRTSKIGGLPDWPVGGCQIPVCCGCNRQQVLVVQLYAPVLASADHRTLFVFACLTPSCWGTQHRYAMSCKH